MKVGRVGRGRSGKVEGGGQGKFGEGPRSGARMGGEGGGKRASVCFLKQESKLLGKQGLRTRYRIGVVQSTEYRVQREQRTE